MANEEFGAYSPATAKMILDVVNYLKSSGLVTSDGKRGYLNYPLPQLTRFRNDSGETIPAYALMQIQGTAELYDRTYHLVSKYNEGSFGGFLFNSKREVENGKTGVAQTVIHPLALGNGGTATLGQLWGASSGSWALTKNGGPWIIAGNSTVATNVVRVQLDVAVTYRAIVTSEISARDGDTDGEGVVTLKHIGPGSATSSFQTGVNVTSLLSDVIAEDTEVIVARTTNGRLQVIAEDCG